MANNKATAMSPMSAGITGAAVGAVGSAIAIALMNKNTRKKVVERADALRQQATGSFSTLKDRGLSLAQKGGIASRKSNGKKHSRKKTTSSKQMQTKS